MAVKDKLGLWGEEYAARFLTLQYGGVVARNWRCAAGEVDLVFLDGKVAVICEVKTRRNDKYGHPFEAIDQKRISRLQNCAEVWAQNHREVNSMRIDAISILCDDIQIMLTHTKGIC